MQSFYKKNKFTYILLWFVFLAFFVSFASAQKKPSCKKFCLGLGGAQKNNTGQDSITLVRSLQEHLNVIRESQGLGKISVDGVFGPETRNAVLNFQKSSLCDNCTWDGIVGEETGGYLRKAFESVKTPKAAEVAEKAQDAISDAINPSGEIPTPDLSYKPASPKFPISDESTAEGSGGTKSGETVIAKTSPGGENLDTSSFGPGSQGESGFSVTGLWEKMKSNLSGYFTTERLTEGKIRNLSPDALIRELDRHSTRSNYCDKLTCTATEEYLESTSDTIRQRLGEMGVGDLKYMPNQKLADLIDKESDNRDGVASAAKAELSRRAENGEKTAQDLLSKTPKDEQRGSDSLVSDEPSASQLASRFSDSGNGEQSESDPKNGGEIRKNTWERSAIECDENYDNCKVREYQRFKRCNESGKCVSVLADVNKDRKEGQRGLVPPGSEVPVDKKKVLLKSNLNNQVLIPNGKGGKKIDPNKVDPLKKSGEIYIADPKKDLQETGKGPQPQYGPPSDPMP